VIGYAAALTGDGAVGDVPALQGAQYAVKELNADGGADGRQLRLVVKDMKSDSALGGTVTQELLDDGAQIVIGPPFPGMAAGVVDVAGQDNVSVISATSTQPEFVAVGGRPAFLAAFGDNVQASAAAQYALDQGAKTVFTVSSPDLTYTGNTPKFFVDAFEHGGGKSLGDVTFTIGQTDFSPQVTKIANLPQQPDIIYTAMFPPDTSAFIRALRAAGVKSRIVGADGFHTDALLEAGAGAVEGTWFTTHAFDEPGTPFGDFIAALTKADGKAPDGPALAGLGYSTVQLIAAAVEKAGSSDPEEIGKAMADLENVDTVTGTVTYKGTSGVPAKTVYIGAIEGGKFVLKDSFTPEYIAEP
jgi:branched-chain amino acid transport system substrate-binding protein